MKIIIEGNMDNDDLVALTMFNREWFAGPDKLVMSSIVEGTEHMNIQELQDKVIARAMAYPLGTNPIVSALIVALREQIKTLQPAASLEHVDMMVLEKQP